MILFLDSSLLTEKAVHYWQQVKMRICISLHYLCYIISNKLKSRPQEVVFLVWCLANGMGQRNKNLPGSEMYGTLIQRQTWGCRDMLPFFFFFVLGAIDPKSKMISSRGEQFQHSIPFNSVHWRKKLILRSPTSSPSAFTNRLFIKVMQLKCFSFRHINVLFNPALCFSVD